MKHTRVQRHDYSAWCDKNEKLNADGSIGRGDLVTNGLDMTGIVVEIHLPEDGAPLSVEDHGGITIWQGEQLGTEHHALYGWRRNLRILEKAGEISCNLD